MNVELLIPMIFKVIGGLGIFLLGMSNLTTGLQTIAGERLRWLIGKVTNNRFMAAAVGTGVTMIVQSSSITTVMVVGFVNSSLMTLNQAIGVIMGANIGTTITGWILAVKIGKYGLPIIGIAALIYLFSKRDRVKYVALAILGLGMVFYGLELMSSGFKPIRSLPQFLAWFKVFDATTYFGIFKCITAGAILTMIVQSSSATLGITIGLASTGVISFETAAALVLGENIGTTITALLASIGAKVNAKRAAYAHTIFNVLGVVWIALLFPIYIILIKKFIGHDPNMIEMVAGEETFPYITAAIASVHTGFNVVNTLIFFPLLPLISKLLMKFVPDAKYIERNRMTKLDGRMYDTPQIALQQSKQEIGTVFDITTNMLDNLLEIIDKGEGKSSTKVQGIFKDEEVIDVMQKEITEYLTELMAANMAVAESLESKHQLRIADEVETVSDYITNILKICLKLKDQNAKLSTEAIEDLRGLHNSVRKYMDLIFNGFNSGNPDLITVATPIKDTIKIEYKDLRNKQIERLSEGNTDPVKTLAYIDILNSYRRINDHLFNIAEETIIE